MPQWIQVSVAELPAEGKSREIVLADRLIALYQVDGVYYALDGVCPHQGGPLGKGMLRGKVVTCPWHGWQFDVTCGQHQISASIRQPSLPTRWMDDELWVDVAPTTDSSPASDTP